MKKFTEEEIKAKAMELAEEKQAKKEAKKLEKQQKAEAKKARREEKKLESEAKWYQTKAAIGGAGVLVGALAACGVAAILSNADSDSSDNADSTEEDQTDIPLNEFIEL